MDLDGQRLAREQQLEQERRRRSRLAGPLVPDFAYRRGIVGRMAPGTQIDDAPWPRQRLRARKFDRHGAPRVQGASFGKRGVVTPMVRCTHKVVGGGSRRYPRKVLRCLVATGAVLAAWARTLARRYGVRISYRIRVDRSRSCPGTGVRSYPHATGRTGCRVTALWARSSSCRRSSARPGP